MKAICTVVALLLALPLSAKAQTFPSKQVTVVIPFVTGGSNDTVGRFLADRLSKLWNQTVVVENRPGAGTAVGSAHVAQSRPDGYKFLISSGTITANAALQPNASFDPVKDLIPVARVASTPVVLLAGPRLKVSDMEGFIREAKSREIFHASSGVGSLPHFGAELLADQAGLKIKSVHYKGGGEIQQDLIGGRVDIVYANAPFALTVLQSDGVKALAVTGDKRFAKLPAIPTLIERGYAKADFSSWWGVFVPAGTPVDIVERLNESINQVMSMPETAAFLDAQGATFEPMTAQQFKKLTDAEFENWRKLARERGMTAN
jgi:tripartite-type tricarboxylate transporter receptor subunit TctC